MLDDLYARDALAWAEQQSELLYRLCGGERVNQAIDWPRVIAEVRDVGLSELRACESLLQQAMTHLLKLHAWPNSLVVAHWHGEAGTFLDDAARRFTPSMRQRVNVGALYAAALRRAGAAIDDAGCPRTLPKNCPFTLDVLLAGDIADLRAALEGAAE